MHTAQAKSETIFGYRAATDPVDSIHSYNIPIPPHKKPPTQEEYKKPDKKRKSPDNDSRKNETSKPGHDGHIDDYA